MKTKIDDAEKIAAVCRGVRAMRGWTQDEMASRMNISIQSLRKIEAGNDIATNYVFGIQMASGLTLGEFDTLQDVYVNSAVRLESAA